MASELQNRSTSFQHARLQNLEEQLKLKITSIIKRCSLQRDLSGHLCLVQNQRPSTRRASHHVDMRSVEPMSCDQLFAAPVHRRPVRRSTLQMCSRGTIATTLTNSFLIRKMPTEKMRESVNLRQTS